MVRIPGRVILTIGLLLGGMGSLARAQELTKADIAKKGKAATVLLEPIGGDRFATAFCIHSSGLFITNEHCVRDRAADSFALVVNSGLKTQKALKAKVVRIDKDLDLALIRVDGELDFPTLVLGSDEDVAELTEVVALGFPFGKGLSLDKGEYPAVSINTGRVTALRMKKGELNRIQLDAVLNPGNSGGPVLDSQGKVIGVVASGVFGASVNFAVPVNHVTRFLAAPDLQFVAPTIAATNLRAAASFQVRAVSLLPKSAPLSIELTLNAEGVADRKFTMLPEGDVFKVSAAPMPALAADEGVRIAVTFSQGAVHGMAADQWIRVGKEKLKLSQIRQINYKPTRAALLKDGKRVEGDVAGLQEIKVRIGEVDYAVKMTGAIQLQVDTPPVAATVLYTIVAKKDGKEVGRLQGALPIQGVSSLPEAVGKLDIKPLPLDKEKVVAVPSTIGDVTVGGGGRYLILNLPKLRKLALFDVNEGKIVHYFPMGEENVLFAAGMDKLVVVAPTARVLQRWSLTTKEKEITIPFPVLGTPSQLLLGSASNGPLFLSGGERYKQTFQFLDLQSLKALEISGKTERDRGLSDLETGFARVSADGTVYGFWRKDSTPSGISTMALIGNKFQLFYDHDDAGHILPGPEGKIIYTARGRYTMEAKPIGNAGRTGGSFCLPAAHGNYYLTLTQSRPNSPSGSPVSGVTIFVDGHDRALLEVGKIDLGEDINRWGRIPFGPDKRIHLIPDAKVLILVPISNDRLVLKPLDVEEGMEKSGIDYLFITSRAPLAASRGKTYAYQMAVKSKKGGVKYSIESGPPAMRVSDQGQVSWPVPADFLDVSVEVIVGVTDASGQQLFQQFRLVLGAKTP